MILQKFTRNIKTAKTTMSQRIPNPKLKLPEKHKPGASTPPSTGKNDPEGDLLNVLQRCLRFFDESSGMSGTKASWKDDRK
jgi:hypothetical protein